MHHGGTSEQGGGTARAAPRCPRCRYDMRASTEGWHEACPTEGRCVECGLVFRWGDIFNPHAAIPRWSVEHAARNRWLRAAAITWLVSALRPRHLWRRLRMTHPIRGRRLAGYVAAVLLLPPLFLLLPGQVVLSARLWREAKRYQAMGPAGPMNFAPSAAPGDADWPAQLSMWCRNVGTGDTIERRLEVPASLVAMIEDAARRTIAWRANRLTLDSGSLEFAFHHVFMPFSTGPPASFIASDGSVQPLPGPLAALTEMLWSARRMDGSRSEDVAVDIGGALCSRVLCGADSGGWGAAPSAWQVMAGLFFPPLTCVALWQLVLGAAVFVALPQTRRRAKVSWAHVGRVTALGAWVAALPSVVPLAWAYYIEMDLLGFAPMSSGDVSLGLFTIRADTGEVFVRVLSLWAVPFLLWLWWSLAARHYLKLPHAWGVGLAQVVIAAGCTLAMYQVTLLGVGRWGP